MAKWPHRSTLDAHPSLDPRGHSSWMRTLDGPVREWVCRGRRRVAEVEVLAIGRRLSGLHPPIQPVGISLRASLSLCPSVSIPPSALAV